MSSQRLVNGTSRVRVSGVLVRNNHPRRSRAHDDALQHHKFEPTKPARKWDSAWRALRDSAGLPGFRFHDLRHTVVTDLLEAGEPEHVIEAITGHLSRKMLEHYSHQRLKAKGQMLARMEERRKQRV